jgi:hypothetical protein
VIINDKYRVWEKYPDLVDAPSDIREKLQRRKRHKNVRYLMFRLRNAMEKNGGVIPSSFDDGYPIPPGFVDHFLTMEIGIIELPTGQRARIVEGRLRTPSEIGGFATFAERWDVDEKLRVYSRHRSVWQEWNATLRRVVPILGEE